MLLIFISITGKEMESEEKLNEVIEALEEFFNKIIIDTNTEQDEKEDNPTID